MINLTRFQIKKPAKDVFEAFVDPSKIGNFWFSSSSERWAAGKTIKLEYDLYNAELEIKVVEVEENNKIVFFWGPPEDEHTVTISLKEMDSSGTIIEIMEEGFQENDAALIHNILDNKEGWVFMLTCLKAYLEFGVNQLRGGLLNNHNS
ncbi:SRPBCC family protein [Neobacillus rhizophilus]|uniref:SRPBCC family protein n=1 Tax=Neobacillus rhizophilus TaxID=2833579 RepID=A0A942U2Q8_9BACI|nr:SRPBCC family protein [Neobacillus rhizophilus]MBS4211202.1 SRPBCC family protein [Neobacillus rhizophilus]